MTMSAPRLEERAERSYVAIRREVTRAELGTVLPPLGDDVFAWLKARGLSPGGAPLFRYLTIDMEGEGRFLVDVGVPVASAVAGDDQVTADVLPAGRYAVLVNTGPYDDLVGAHGALHAWMAENGVAVQPSAAGNGPAAMVEAYETDPAEEPDPQKWETEVSYLVTER
jgi:effector-binding domain-containing protein